jgi:hypothetical protein
MDVVADPAILHFLVEYFSWVCIIREALQLKQSAAVGLKAQQSKLT